MSIFAVHFIAVTQVWSMNCGPLKALTTWGKWRTARAKGFFVHALQ